MGELKKRGENELFRIIKWEEHFDDDDDHKRHTTNLKTLRLDSLLAAPAQRISLTFFLFHFQQMI
jgi:hypothetical protein